MKTIGTRNERGVFMNGQIDKGVGDHRWIHCRPADAAEWRERQRWTICVEYKIAASTGPV